MTYDPEYLNNLKRIFENDIGVIQHKEKTYRGSWMEYGGVSGFMNLARKWDRLKNMCSDNGYDVFKAVEDGGHIGDDGTALAEIRDLRRYLALVEAWMVYTGRATLHSEYTGASSDRVELRPATPLPASHSDLPTGSETAEKLAAMDEPHTPGTPADGGHHAKIKTSEDWLYWSDTHPMIYRDFYTDNLTVGPPHLKIHVSVDRWMSMPHEMQRMYELSSTPGEYFLGQKYLDQLQADRDADFD